MPHDFKVSDVLAGAMLDAGAAVLNAGSIEFYSLGSGVPATLATAITDQTLLAVLTLSATAFAAAVAAVAALNAVTGDPSINATDVGAFFRIKDSGGTVHVQGLCGTSVSDANLNTLNFVTGQTADITAGALSLG